MVHNIRTAIAKLIIWQRSFFGFNPTYPRLEYKPQDNTADDVRTSNATKPHLPFQISGRNIVATSAQCLGCWCPGSYYHRTTSSHIIDNVLLKRYEGKFRYQRWCHKTENILIDYKMNFATCTFTHKHNLFLGVSLILCFILIKMDFLNVLYVKLFLHMPYYITLAWLSRIFWLPRDWNVVHWFACECSTSFGKNCCIWVGKFNEKRKCNHLENFDDMKTSIDVFCQP